MNKKGSIFDGIIWVVIAFVTILLFVMLQYGTGILHQGLLASGDSSVVDATNTIMTPYISTQAKYLPILAYIILFGGIISIFVSNFIIRDHPVFYILYVLFTIISVVISATLSNRYQELLSNNLIGATMQTYTAGNFIMQWLPYFAAVIGIFGAVFLLIGTIRDRGAGGQII